MAKPAIPLDEVYRVHEVRFTNLPLWSIKLLMPVKALSGMGGLKKGDIYTLVAIDGKGRCHVRKDGAMIDRVGGFTLDCFAGPELTEENWERLSKWDWSTAADAT